MANFIKFRFQKNSNLISIIIISLCLISFITSKTKKNDIQFENLRQLEEETTTQHTSSSLNKTHTSSEVNNYTNQIIAPFTNKYNNSIEITLSEKVSYGGFYLFPKGLRQNIFISKIIYVSKRDNSEKELEVNGPKYRIPQANENDKLIIVFSNKIEDASELFKGSRYIKRVNLNKLDFSIMKSMKSMFENCDYLITIFAIYIQAPQLKDMSSLFEHCNRLLNVEIKYFTALELEDMSKMFKTCSSLSVVNLSKFKTKILNDMSEMFKDCTDLDTVDFSNMVVAQHLTMEKMFENCDSLDNVFMDNFKMSTFCECDFTDLFEGIEDLDEIVFSIDNANVPTEFLDILYYSDISVVGNQNYTDPYGYDREPPFDDDDDEDDSGMDEDDEFIDDNGNDEGLDLKDTVNNTAPPEINDTVIQTAKTTIKKKKISTKGVIGLIIALAIGISVFSYTCIALIRCHRENEDAIPVKYSSSL